MIKTQMEISERIVTMLSSEKEEDRVIAIQALQSEHPLVWAALTGYTGLAHGRDKAVDGKKLLAAIHKSKDYSLGSNVRYKGLRESPLMVVINISASEFTSAAKLKSYAVMLECKYFNKSSQTFVTITDRLECFEPIKPNQDGSLQVAE